MESLVPQLIRNAPLLIEIEALRRCPQFEREGGGLAWENAKEKAGYVVRVPLKIDLGEGVDLPFYADETRGFWLEGRFLWVSAGLWWDGATWALDWKSHLASLVHDCLCWAADAGHKHSGVWRQNIFISICRAQGMGRLECSFRWIALQSIGRVYQAL